MAMRVSEVAKWLKTLNPKDFVFIDEGGLCLCSVADDKAYCEVGGDPEQAEDDEEDD